MELSTEVYEISIAIGFVAAGLALVAYLTKDSTNFRSSRNRKARKQHS